MSCALKLTGSLVVDGGDCGCSGGGGAKSVPLKLQCASSSYAAIVSTDCAQSIQTAGAVGQNWRELPVAESLAEVHFLSVLGSAPFRLRIGADGAYRTGSGGTFPTSFAGGETFAFTLDGVAVAVVFTSGAQSAAQVAAQINQAAIAAGFSYLPATVLTSGQLEIRGLLTGEQGSLLVTTANATIGFTGTSSSKGAGEDVDSRGLFLNQFDPSSAPRRVQISGVAQIEVFAAGAP